MQSEQEDNHNEKGITMTPDVEAVVIRARAWGHREGTRRKFESRWRDSWNAYEVTAGVGALTQSEPGEVPTMIASEPPKLWQGSSEDTGWNVELH